MEILYAILIVAGIGVLCAVLLVVASHFMSVPVDEKEQKVRECLPGANCGACGYTGCDGYAKALADGSETRTNLCIPGSDKVAKDVAKVLGVEAADVIEQVAFVHCLGDCEKKTFKHEYQGIETCAAAKTLYGGEADCTYGCLGYGDCARVCPVDAICIENGIAHVDPRKCIGCGLCAKTCPNNVIGLIDDIEKAVITCNNKEKGAVARKKCSNACIKCKKCEKACPLGAIKVNDIAVIDYSICEGCGACVDVCPTGCISKLDLTGKHNIEKND